MKRDSVVLIVALVCGLAAFSLIFNFLKQVSQPKGQYVITKAEIPKGKILVLEDLTLSEEMANVPAQQHFTQMYEVIGMEALQDLPPQHLVQRGELKKPEIKIEEKKVEPVVPVDLVLPVPAGMRALTLGMQELESIPPGLKSGDYADILGNVIVAANQNEVRTIVRGILVLAVPKTPDTKQVLGLSVALFPAQVESVLNAARYGRMRLVITQKPADNTAWPDMGSIEVIRGVQREKKIT